MVASDTMSQRQQPLVQRSACENNVKRIKCKCSCPSSLQKKKLEQVPVDILKRSLKNKKNVKGSNSSKFQQVKVGHLSHPGGSHRLCGQSLKPVTCAEYVPWCTLSLGNAAICCHTLQHVHQIDGKDAPAIAIHYLCTALSCTISIYLHTSYPHYSKSVYHYYSATLLPLSCELLSKWP